MINKIMTIFFLFILGYCTTIKGQTDLDVWLTENSYSETLYQYVTSDKLYGYVSQLSNDSLEGRLVGTRGMHKANQIMIDRFKQFGILPFKGNQFEQTFHHPIIEIGKECSLEIYFPVKTSVSLETEKTCTWADDWFAGSMSDNGEVKAEVVFAGYGISAPELNYDDYSDIDVVNKIVLIQGDSPNRSNKPDDIKKWYTYTLHDTKFKTALEKGAIGILYKWVPTPNVSFHKRCIYCHVNKSLVNDLFSGSGHDYVKTIDEIIRTKKPCSFFTGKIARIKIESTFNDKAVGQNLVGVIPGNDPKLMDEYVVITAHLDGLGMLPGVMPGANDNCSSSAVLLGIAEALSKVENKRSIILVSTDGEEAGLTGSLNLISDQMFAEKKIVAVLNLEQVGVGEQVRIFSSYLFPGLKSIMNYVNNRFVHRNLYLGDHYFQHRPRTDGAVFMKAGYPCVDIKASNDIRYHSPNDRVENINPNMLKSIAELTYWTTIILANMRNVDLTQKSPVSLNK